MKRDELGMRRRVLGEEHPDLLLGNCGYPGTVAHVPREVHVQRATADGSDSEPPSVDGPLQLTGPFKLRLRMPLTSCLHPAAISEI
jgi:hypothetical protein